MKFSIVVVSLNAGNDLINTINSILNQTYKDYEIIIKDGQSSDGSLKMIPEDNKIRCIVKKDSGIYDAMNQALDEIDSDYTIFLNCGDTFFDSEVLHKTNEAIQKEKASIYYGDCYNSGEDHYNSYPNKITAFTCYRTMICHQSTFYSTSLIKKIRYDLSYKVLADKQLLVTLVKKYKVKNRYLGYTVCDYKAGGFCESNSSKKIAKMELVRLKKNNYKLLERVKYNILIFLSCKSLRSFLIKNKLFSQFYYRMLRKIYRISG